MLENWCSFVKPLGVEPWLQGATYQQRVRCLTGFTVYVRLGQYGQGKQVAIGTFSEAIEVGGRRIHPPRKKISVGIDAPNVLAGLGMEKYATEMVKAVGNCARIEFYCLLRV